MDQNDVKNNNIITEVEEVKKISTDIKISQEGLDNIKLLDYSFSFVLPDLLVPFSMVYGEIGYVTLNNLYGSKKVKFKSSFPTTPGFVSSVIGYLSLSIPILHITYNRVCFTIPVINIRVCLPIPIPSISVSWRRIFLPAPCFIIGVERDGFIVFGAANKVVISYIALSK